MKDFHIEHGTLFRKHETHQAESETALRDHLMRTRPEIFPVHIVQVPALTLEPKYQDTLHEREVRDVPFEFGGGHDY